MEFLTEHRLPIGPGKGLSRWLTRNGDWFFNWLSAFLAACINGLLFVLQWPHPLVVVALITGLSWWLRRSIGLALFTALGFLLIINQGYWKETTETLALVLASTAVSMIVGVPLGILAARRAWLYGVMRPVLDLMQTIPTFVYLIPALILFVWAWSRG